MMPPISRVQGAHRPDRNRPLSARILALIGCLAAAAGAGTAQAETLSFLADDYCPNTCADPDRPGYMIEIARAVFEPQGYHVAYKLMGWARAIEETRTGRYAAVVGGSEEEFAGLVWSGPIGLWRVAGATRRGQSFDPESSSLDGLVLGAIRGYHYNDRIDDHIAQHGSDPRRVQFASGDDALLQNLRRLVGGRLDVVVDDPNVLRFVVGSAGMENAVELTPAATAIPLGIGFSPALPQARTLAGLLGEGIARLRREGRLAVILARYGLEDWPPSNP